MICSNLNTLLKAINERKPEIIVVEGYNGVGKSKVLSYLSSELSVNVYRPNYMSWNSELPRSLRWTIFASFVDTTHYYLTMNNSLSTALIDRGFFSGVVYNNDISLLKFYKDIVKGFSVLHILVACSEEDYNRFLSVRGSSKKLNYHDYIKYTERYRISMNAVGAEYIEYVNTFDEAFASKAKDTCLGCGHYNQSICCNENSLFYKSTVSEDNERCSEFKCLEVQDKIGELV